MRVKDRTQSDSQQCAQYQMESGLPVYKVIDDTEASDPFLLFDHIGPVTFRPGEAVGAADHPHRGMELISVLLQGSVHHADSAGHDSVLPAGTVQHIRFGRGLVHFEMPGPALVESGGTLEGYQIWVNLPPADKLCNPVYTEVAPDDLPRVRTEDGGAEIRVISGTSHGVEGAVSCVTPCCCWMYN
ncbi:hypothetical protein BOX15_Mlig028553g1 [Macrostomum lignano]|uniref:Pirin N-terminal domain-containing protein n=1 Tax=Macrostomum lignano TaxID=282301 RepID=A0A267GPH1_9PLAT|nr:hypothetical protein BOX15_Mlig028553g1 [Macrostomum lignano]